MSLMVSTDGPTILKDYRSLRAAADKHESEAEIQDSFTPAEIKEAAADHITARTWSGGMSDPGAEVTYKEADGKLEVTARYPSTLFDTGPLNTDVRTVDIASQKLVSHVVNGKAMPMEKTTTPAAPPAPGPGQQARDLYLGLLKDIREFEETHAGAKDATFHRDGKQYTILENQRHTVPDGMAGGGTPFQGTLKVSEWDGCMSSVGSTITFQPRAECGWVSHVHYTKDTPANPFMHKDAEHTSFVFSIHDGAIET